MDNVTEYVFLDDDALSNVLGEKLVRKLLPDPAIISFTDPIAGSRYFIERSKDGIKLVVFLDIDMPVLNGWEVLESIQYQFNELPNNSRIFILSSSIDTSDKSRASDHKLVTDYIEKPLSLEVLMKIIK
ncbi:MAG: response regulator [Flavobacteriales bacterium]|nr:response regulator [Flavobacteriales bacterium]